MPNESSRSLAGTDGTTFQNEVLAFIDPVYRWCLKRIQNRYDAEDLASEIMIYVLDGIHKYEIKSLEAWVWRIAHNRYARWYRNKMNHTEEYGEELMMDCMGTYDFVDELAVTSEYDEVFRCLHRLCSQYKNLMVDYYIEERSVKQLAKKYSLSETTVKWRLNVGRTKMKEWMGETDMEKVYKRINWETTSCNGGMNTSAYLSSQVARAICEAAYEKPVTIEEISQKTGLPTMYIEDALPNLIYGDAIEQTGNKYTTDFIVLRLKDQMAMEKEMLPLIGTFSNYFEQLIAKSADSIGKMDFFGHDFGKERLGYIIVPFVIRQLITQAGKSLEDFERGPFPPRKDGGYGWFIVEETKDETEALSEQCSGCNIASDDDGAIYYYHTYKYFDPDIYNNGGTLWMKDNKIVQGCRQGQIPEERLEKDDEARLLERNLLKKKEGNLYLNFPYFTQEQFQKFSDCCLADADEMREIVRKLILTIKKSFLGFVPKRLNSQINQWVSCFTGSISGYVLIELIQRGVLAKPEPDRLMTNGVFYVEGKYINL